MFDKKWLFLKNYDSIIVFLNFLLDNVHILSSLSVLVIFFFEFKGHAVHSHDYSDVFNVMHLDYVFFWEVWKNLSDPYLKDFFAFFIRIGNHEAIYVNERHFVCFEEFTVSNENIQKLYSVDGKVHIYMVGLSELLREFLFFFVKLSHRLSCAHVHADHVLLDFIEFAIDL